MFHIIRRSLSYNKPASLYMAAVTLILTAIITGSLLTGSSVRESLKTASTEKLGNTGIVISSINRYFDPTLTERLATISGASCAGFLEINGYCQNFSSGQSALGVKIYAADSSFFEFQGIKNAEIRKGEAVINEKLARYLGLKSGDDFIIRFKPLSDIPSDAPFAPKEDGTGSLVLKIGNILDVKNSGNFSLGISQITPLNIFINPDDLTDATGRIRKINRIIIDHNYGHTISEIYSDLQKILKPEDIGLRLRFIRRTGNFEIVSDRIFIDQSVIDEITRALPSAFPVITYLGNSFDHNGRSAPYSFVSALPESLYPDIPEGNRIIINKWLAGDIKVKEGDTLTLSWYSPDPLTRLVEKKSNFLIQKITDIKGVWADSLLMPEFPGIAGKESCTEWDAGVSIKMDRIRKKDEDYWNVYRGTPKAFINYETGKSLWGSNFGPATSVRFPADITGEYIKSRLAGSLSPDKSGFSITDIYADSIKAASEGVDFSTLFLSLGFFIIFSSIVLLVLVSSAYFEAKKEHIATMFSLGFTNRWIKRFTFMESGFIAITGTITGAVSGLLFNYLIVKALNSVWRGAVQTNTLNSYYDPFMVLLGFIVSFTVILVILWIKSTVLLKSLGENRTATFKRPSLRINIISFILVLIAAIALITCSFIFPKNAIVFSFSAGIAMFFTLILLSRYRYLRVPDTSGFGFRKSSHLSRLYYGLNSSRAVVPSIFLAAGLFAVIITGVNRLNINDSMLKPSGGTGGYILWGESALPVPGNLNSIEGKRELGLDENDLKDISFVQAGKLSGDDASCLNLNHITSPPLLGLDPSDFINRKAFSFASVIKNSTVDDPWSLLDSRPAENTIFGIADQTVLQYGLKIRSGDTLKIRSESGRVINVVIAGGLKPSVFQGYVIISRTDLNRFFPSVSGSQIFLVNGDPERTNIYLNMLTERLSGYGTHFETASERLSSFFVVTNTYLSVFSILGGLGLILGVIGLGFILLRNFNQRKKEFGLLMAAGFSLREIKRMILGDQLRILFTGLVTGLVPALITTIHSLLTNAEIPWINISTMILLIVVTGYAAVSFSLKPIRSNTLIQSIRKE